MNPAGITRLADRIDRLNTAVGRAASWCALFIVLTGFGVVLMRYVLGLGSLWLQESILYAHAALFLLAAAWTLKEGGHVRVDVFYASASQYARPPTEPGCSRVRHYKLIDIGNIRCRLEREGRCRANARRRGGVSRLHPHPARVHDARRPPPSRGR